VAGDLGLITNIALAFFLPCPSRVIRVAIGVRAMSAVVVSITTRVTDTEVLYESVYARPCSQYVKSLQIFVSCYLLFRL